MGKKRRARVTGHRTWLFHAPSEYHITRCEKIPGLWFLVSRKNFEDRFLSYAGRITDQLQLENKVITAMPQKTERATSSSRSVPATRHPLPDTSGLPDLYILPDPDIGVDSPNVRSGIADSFLTGGGCVV